jgi:hypothetical protein
MEVMRFSETSANARSTQRHIPQDDILHIHRCENLKSYIDLLDVLQSYQTYHTSVSNEADMYSLGAPFRILSNVIFHYTAISLYK